MVVVEESAIELDSVFGRNCAVDGAAGLNESVLQQILTLGS